MNRMIFLTLCICVLVFAGCSRVGAQQAKAQPANCINNFKWHGTAYCAIPLIALISKFSDYSGKNVHTYGYISYRRGAHQASVSYAADNALRVDYFSCVLIDLDGVDLQNQLMEGDLVDGVYFSQIRGAFSLIPDAEACVGTIDDASVTILSRIE